MAFLAPILGAVARSVLPALARGAVASGVEGAAASTGEKLAGQVIKSGLSGGGNNDSGSNTSSVTPFSVGNESAAMSRVAQFQAGSAG